MVSRRGFLHRTALVAGTYATALLLPSRSIGHAAPVAQPIGPPVPDPAELLDLPAGFRYRVLIRTGDSMAGGQEFRPDPDLNAVIDLADGTHYLVTSHEIRADLEYEGRFTGALSRLHLGPGGEVLDARLLAEGMRNNCSGSATPWGTVLTNEESPRQPFEAFPDEGYIWEVDPRSGEKWRRDQMGRFSHESTAVDPATGEVYLTADFRGGALYKFVPDRPGDLASGALFAFVAPQRAWVRVEDPYRAHDEALAKGATPYNRDEDLEWGRDGALYVCETGNETGPVRQRDLFGRIRRLDPRTGASEVFVEGGVQTLIMPDNITVDAAGTFFVCEDKSDPMLQLAGDNNVVRVAPDGQTSFFATLRGGREPSGVVFSPDHRTLYLNVLEPEGMVLAITGF